MSKARPITAAIEELREVADFIREESTVNGQWPESKVQARFEWMRLMSLVRQAEKEWSQVRQETLRLNQIESVPEDDSDLNFVFFSGNADPLKFDAVDRRYTIVWSGDDDTEVEEENTKCE